MTKYFETQTLELKEFSKIPDTDSGKKSIKSKLFIEITAMANSRGGEIIIGVDDKTYDIIPQPSHVLDLLHNDTLARFINEISDNLVIVSSKKSDDGTTIIEIPVSETLISASKDYKGLNKGDIFLRENTEAKKATPQQISKIYEKRIQLPIDKKLEKLKFIVKQKFKEGRNNENDLNIFDSLVITLRESKTKDIETLYDMNRFWEFALSYQLPLSEFISQSMHNRATYILLHKNDKNITNMNLIKLKKELLDSFSKGTELKRLIKSWRNQALNSKELDDYIKTFS